MIFNVIMILNFLKKKFLNLKKNLKKNYSIIKLSGKNFLLIRDNNNNYKNIKYSNLPYLLPFFASTIHKVLSKLYKFLFSYLLLFIK